MTHSPTELKRLMAEAKFGPLSCDNYFPSEIFEETAKGPSKAIEIRGWGWLQKQEDGAQVQDARGRLVLAALNSLEAMLEVIEAAKLIADWHDDVHCGNGVRYARLVIDLRGKLSAFEGKGVDHE